MFPLTFIIWLALVAGAGWTAFPLAHRAIGADLPDAGLAVGRISFLGIWTMLAFWLGHAGVAVAAGAWLYAPLAALGIWVGWRDRDAIREVWRHKRRAIVATEAIFLAVFLGFFLLRGFWSDTNGDNGEKGMDSALIAATVRAQRLPPPNPYAAGARISSYYYFGPLQTALLTRAAGTQMRWSYNLMCATLPALCFAALFSLGAALTGSLKGGAWVAGAVLGGGTLQPLYQWTHPDIYTPLRLLGLDAFAISRVIPYTINEFPWFTFNQGDLHGHLFDFPFQIALMSLGWSLYRTKRLAVVLLAAVLCGATILTNTWDFPVFTLLVGLSIVLASPTSTAWSAPSVVRRLNVRIGLAISVGVVALVVAAPFLLHLQSAANPPQLLAQPASPLREWLLMWAPIALCWWIFAAAIIFERNTTWHATLLMMATGVGAAALFAPWQAPSILVLPIIAASAGFALAGLFNRGDRERYGCVLALCGLLALAWSEVSWAGFIGSAGYTGIDDFKRQDTVFKFGLQVWMLWGTAAAAGLWLALVRAARPVRSVVVAALVPLALVMWAGNLTFTLHRIRFVPMLQAQRMGLDNWFAFDAWDGWAHLAPPEKAAANWLLRHVAADETLVEAENRDGGDFTSYARYAAATGVPTVMGPLAHTFYWAPANAKTGRGSKAREAKSAAEWAEVYRRKTDVQRIYAPIAAPERAQILRSYGVKYLMWGELERLEYGQAAYGSVADGLPIAAQFGQGDDPHRVTILRVE